MIRATQRLPMVKLSARNAAVPRDAEEHRPDDDFPLRREAADEGENGPPDGVIEDRRGEDDLAEIAPQKIDLAQHGGDDFDRGNRERGGEKQRGDEAALRIGQDALGEHLAERVAEGKRNDDARGGGDRGGAAHAFHQPEIRLHAGEQEQQEHAEFGHRAEHLPVGRGGGKEPVLARAARPRRRRSGRG